jgi:hypothetical protein
MTQNRGQSQVEWQQILHKEILLPVWRGFPLRTRKIFEQRFGIEGKAPASLQAVGDRWKITRERVRQIIERAIAATEINPHSPLAQVQLRLREHIRRQGGVMVEEKLFSSLGLGKEEKQAQGVLRVVLSLDKKIGFRRRRKNFRTYWYLLPCSPSYIKKVCREAREIFQARGAPLTLEQLTAAFQTQGKKIEPVKLAAVLSTDISVGRSPFGLWGLAKWATIYPKLVADKAYLVLKHIGRPLHFEELAEEIRRVHFDEHVPVAGSVHNELMRDERFVRVGRGTYALTEWQPHVA